MKPSTLFSKVWDQHQVVPETADRPGLLYIDLQLIHEVTSPQAFTELRQRDLPVRQPQRVLATMDHSTPTTPLNSKGQFTGMDPQAAKQVKTLEDNCRDFGLTLHGLGSEYRGIVHVIGPELGATQPGKTIVCGDSHTSTHGAFGALAFGIGSTEVGHVLASQCLLQRRPKTMSIQVDGRLAKGVSAKDLILYIIGKIGVGGGTGHVIEYRGEAIQALDMEKRMTVCNMSIEAGARAGMIAPDETTFAYLKGRPMAPQGKSWDAAVEQWRQLVSDKGASFDAQVKLNANDIPPMITYGTHPGMVMGITETIPTDPKNPNLQKAMDYMGLQAGKALLGQAIDVVFVGSCTNGRLSDLRQAANILKGRKVAQGVRAMIVPGSEQVKKQAQAEGLHQIFLAAGAEWREPGCSMCIAMNGDMLQPGQYAVSTSNRNFAGRQGKGSRSFLASPASAAAAAVQGKVTDPREFMA